MREVIPSVKVGDAPSATSLPINNYNVDEREHFFVAMICMGSLPSKIAHGQLGCDGDMN